MLNVSDLQQEQAAARGLWLPPPKPQTVILSHIASHKIVFPFMTKGARLETAVQLHDGVLL